MPCASLSASISALSCWSYDDLKYTEEAHIFADQQKNVKKLTPYETFIAHVEAGDAKQAMIKTIVESYGLVVSSTQQPNGISDIDAYNSKARKKEAEQLDVKIKAENALKEYKNALKYALDCYIEAINELPYLAQVTNTNQCSFYTGFKTSELKLVGRVVNSGHMIKKFKENYGTVYFYADTKGAVFFRYYTYVSEFKDKEHTVSITVDEFKQIFQSIISDIKLPTGAYLYHIVYLL